MVGDGVLVGLLAPGADWVLFLVKPVVLHAVCCSYHRRSFRGYHFYRFCLCNPCPGTEDLDSHDCNQWLPWNCTLQGTKIFSLHTKTTWLRCSPRDQRVLVLSTLVLSKCPKATRIFSQDVWQAVFVQHFLHLDLAQEKPTEFFISWRLSMCQNKAHIPWWGLFFLGSASAKRIRSQFHPPVDERRLTNQHLKQLSVSTSRWESFGIFQLKEAFLAWISSLEPRSEIWRTKKPLDFHENPLNYHINRLFLV